MHRLIGLALLIVPLSESVCRAADRPPNLVIILADDK